MSAAGFHAAVVVVEENQDAFIVGLAEDETGDGACLVFQSALRPPDEQDVAAGMDSFCMLGEDDAIEYAGVVSATLADGALTLVLTEEAAEEFEIENDMRTIEIGVPATDVPRLAAGLHRIFTYGDPARQPRLAGIEAGV